MANTKLDRIERDIEKTRAKILEYQKRLKDLEAQKIEEENAQIVQMVKAVHLDGAQLAAFLSAYASGEIALPQPDADYTDEQEETEDEASPFSALLCSLSLAFRRCILHSFFPCPVPVRRRIAHALYISCRWCAG